MKQLSYQICYWMICSFCLSIPSIQAQIYLDHFGTGNNVGVKVSSSSEQGIDQADQTLNGTGNYPDLTGASRFMSQATFGASYEEIEAITQIGMNAWIDQQIAIPYSSYLTTYQNIYDEVSTMIQTIHPGNTDLLDRKRDYLMYTFYEKLFKDTDILRQKMAFALSQILVSSINNGELDGRGRAMASYYDVLYQGAFGNFRTLLENVSLHPAMGIYLSHFKNAKADPDAGTLPDENFAREIMQLFSIGLFELNIDGTYKLDGNDERISTYDIIDIQELSRIFTGLSGGDWDLVLNPQNEGTPLVFHKNFNHYDLTVPMVMYEEYHDTEPKTLIDGTTTPANQSGMADIQQAIDALFNHENVGPFISKRLIQQLVKSNPTKQYIKRVATIFNDNGQGIRGDLSAVLRAILLDPEARECEWIDNEKSGKLKQPLEKWTSLFSAFDISSPSGKLWFRDFQLIYDKVEQSFLAAPSVFNFFSPFYAEDNYVSPNEMVSPEFEILHSVSAIHYLNTMENAIKNKPFPNRTAVHPDFPRLNNNNDDDPILDFSDEIAIYETAGLNPLIERLDIIVCQGQLSSEIKSIIEETLNQYIANQNNYTSEDVVHDALYFITASADFNILK